MKVIIKRSKDKQYYFTVVASNGRTLTTSETYKQKQSCRMGVVSLCVGFVRGKYKVIDNTKRKKP